LRVEPPGESVTGIYHLSVKIIGRGSGRSAVGAAAYRSAEKLKSVGAAAYRSGQDLGDGGGEITTTIPKKAALYTKK